VGAARRRAGTRDFALNADDPLIADLGRDARARARGRPLLRHRGRRQALPELQHAFDAKHCRRCGHPTPTRAPSSATSATTPVPTAAPTGPARRRRDRIELRGMRGSRSRCGPRRRAALELPLPGLYNVYNALAAIAAALELGIEPRRIAPALSGLRGAFGRVETVAIGAKQVSILLVKNPAGPTRSCDAEARGGRRRARPLAGAQRPHRRRPRRLLGLGRRLRAVGGAVARSPAPAPERRRCAATQVRGLAAGLDRVEPEIEAFARPGRGGGARPPLRPADLHGLLELHKLLSDRGLAEEFWR
jgi:hypothetical protein